jgi:hypothetical protein
MRKLLSLKKWLTTAEAASHLSLVWKETVSEADVLRLALDGHLKLSVSFVNHARGRRGTIVPIEQARTFEMPAAGLPFAKLPPGVPSQSVVQIVEGINLDDGNILELDDRVETLRGVYDLPMIGGEELDVEHKYQDLSGGPSVTLSNLEGAFVEDERGTLFQLQESYDDNEYVGGSRASLAKLKVEIAKGQISAGEVDILLAQEAKARKKLLERARDRSDANSYYPAGGLPSDSVLVVRPSALSRFLDKSDLQDQKDQLTLRTRSETTYQNIIGGLLDLLLGKTPGGRAHSIFKDQTAIVEALLASQPGRPGLSKRTLEAKFAQAKRTLKSP